MEFEPVTENARGAPGGAPASPGARAALSGYQKGHCFYCYAPINIAGGSAVTGQVDHLFAWADRAADRWRTCSDGVWNLVLACARCNGWHVKGARPPHVRYVERRNVRNEFLIASYQPPRPTLMAQTGATAWERAATLRSALGQASVGGAREQWLAPEELPPAF